MEEKYVVTENHNSVNSVIRQTFEVTQRIKLTCFDVSHQYMVFGASSGGIYIFIRDPCQFVKLIPSKDGAVSKVLISPEEKTVAVGTTRGVLIILENCFNSNNLKYQVYLEHAGSEITTLRWKCNELYSGDNTGKVSVVNTNNVLSRSIFQSPSASLMKLESSVVQIDAYSTFLLVSTRNKTFLCNTEKEYFKQIGKKLRDGPFGGCFYNILNQNGFNENANSDVTIFCARPGMRLWQADFEGSVIFTHHYKSSSTDSLDFVQLNEGMIIEPSNNVILSSENFNFGKLYTICDKFILTFQSDGLYIINPSTNSILFRSNSFNDIVDIKTTTNYLYIWRENCEMTVFSIHKLEDLILNRLFNKQYYTCSELCIRFSEDILSLAKRSKRILLVTVLRTKLPAEQVEKMSHLLEELEAIAKMRQDGQKSQTGMVTIIQNNYFLENEASISSNFPEKCEYVPNANDLEFDYESYKDTLNGDNLVSNKTAGLGVGDIKVDIFFKQYNLNKTNDNIETSEFRQLLQSTDADGVCSLFMDFVDRNESDGDILMWSYDRLLAYYSIITSDVGIDLGESNVIFLINGFVEINRTVNSICKCGFPLPSASLKLPKYYKLGCRIIDERKNFEKIVKYVPYMFKHHLTALTDDDVKNNLSLIVQFGDLEIVKAHAKTISFDMCDDIINLFVKLKQQRVCLNCGGSLGKSDFRTTWNDLGLILMHSIGGSNILKLFKRYQKHIPHEDLDADFYKTCIFSTVVINSSGRSYLENSLDLSQVLLKDGITGRKFEELMTNFLEEKYQGLESLSPSYGKLQNSTDCSYCRLPVNIPVMKEYKNLNCGHIFHTICCSKIRKICNICYNRITINNE